MMYRKSLAINKIANNKDIHEMRDKSDKGSAIYRLSRPMDPADKDELINNLLALLTPLEIQYLQDLACGESHEKIAHSMDKSPRHLEQLMLRIRRKLSNTPLDKAPAMSRNEVLYLAGLINILEIH